MRRFVFNSKYLTQERGHRLDGALERAVREECELKSLVVYYARTGNTRFVAGRIAQEIWADISETIDKKKRSSLLGFIVSGYDSTRGKETKIADVNKSPKHYDLIVIGKPMWNKRITPAFRKYLKSNDVSEKKVTFYCKNQGFSAR